MAEHERHESKDELKFAITEEQAVWYRGKYSNDPIVTVVKLQVLTS
jgi:hypothetical protein